MQRQTIHLIIEDIRSGNHVRRLAALRRLEELGVESVVAVSDLMRLTDNGDENVVVAARRVLRKMGVAAIPQLVDMLEDPEEREEFRAEAANLLAELGDPGLACLSSAMLQPNVGTRLFAVEALPRAGAPSLKCVPALKSLLSDPSNVGSSAAISLACLSNYESAPDGDGFSAKKALFDGFEQGSDLVRDRIMSAIVFVDDSDFASLIRKGVRGESKGSGSDSGRETGRETGT